MKKIFLAFFTCLLLLFGFSLTTSADLFSNKGKDSIPYKIDCGNDGCVQKGINDIKSEIKDSYTDGKAVDRLQDIVAYLLGFLYFIGVVIIIYSGFMILTANGDEEKVSKAKKIILYVVIGFVVIFLAGPITDFIIEMFNSSNK